MSDHISDDPHVCKIAMIDAKGAEKLLACDLEHFAYNRRSSLRAALEAVAKGRKPGPVAPIMPPESPAWPISAVAR